MLKNIPKYIPDLLVIYFFGSFIFSFFPLPSTPKINGVTVSTTEFIKAIWPLGLFLLPFLFIVIYHIKKLLTTIALDVIGEIKYGYVLKVYVNRQPGNKHGICAARIILLDGENPRTFDTNIGYSVTCPSGSYVKVKQFKNNITIISSVDENSIPSALSSWVRTNMYDMTNKNIDMINYEPKVNTDDIEPLIKESSKHKNDVDWY